LLFYSYNGLFSKKSKYFLKYFLTFSEKSLFL